MRGIDWQPLNFDLIVHLSCTIQQGMEVFLLEEDALKTWINHIKPMK